MAAAAKAGYRRLLRTVLRLDGSTDALLQHAKERFRQEGQRRLTRKRATVRLQKLNALCDAAECATQVPEVQAALDSLGQPYGSTAYRRMVEATLVESVAFFDERTQRGEADAIATDARQNQLMVQACVPHIQRLATLARDDLTDTEMLSALTPQRSSARMQLLPLSPTSTIVVETDDELRRQVVAIRIADLPADMHPDYHEVREMSGLSKVVCQAEWLAAAENIVDVLLHETALHRSRGTVVCGHGAAGPVALAVGLLLHVQQFPVRNVITTGAPRLLSQVRERDIAAVTPIRFAMSGDGRVNVPTKGADGHEFFHRGEAFLVDAPRASDCSFGAADYLHALTHEAAEITYMGDDRDEFDTGPDIYQPPPL